MQIVIVGAGLAGLTAAVRLSQRGHKVQVLERTPHLAPRGGGISIQPGATRVLHSWGLRSEFESISTDTPLLSFRSLRIGELIQKTVVVGGSEYPEWGTSRQAVVNLLYRLATDAGCQVRFGVLVVNVRDGGVEDRPSAELVDGTSIQADLVIIADGIASRLRPKILSDINSAISPIISDFTFYSTYIPMSKLKERPGTSRLYNQTNTNSWAGNGVFAITRFEAKTDEVGFLFCIKSETDQRGLWDEEGDIDYVRKSFQGSTCSEISTALGLAESCDRWKLAEMPDLPRWTSQGGRVVLLGDCAHGMHPNAAQGYSQIVEDIGVLDYLLTELHPRLPIVEITSAWQDTRKPRVERIRDFARWNTKVYSGELAFKPSKRGTSKSSEISYRDLKDVRPDMRAPFSSAAFLKWALDYDAVNEAKRFQDQINSKL